MAKDLPYFRFTPQEWQNGDISLESYELQGFFINICSYYWVQNCSITKSMLEKKFKHDISLINELEKAEIFHHNKKTDFIKISFLDEQFDVLSTKRKLRQEAGSKGGKQKASNATNLLKQKSSYKDKDKDKDNLSPNPLKGESNDEPKKQISEKEQIEKFLEFFNNLVFQKTGSKGQFRTLDKPSIKNLKNLKAVYPNQNDWSIAFKAMMENPWVIENDTGTPKHFLINNNFQKYLNAGNQVKKWKQPY